MEIIKDLDGSRNLVDPLTRDKRITIWNNYYINVKHPDRTVVGKSGELGTFSSCRCFTSSNSDSTSGRESDFFFPFSFS